jgi:hypothetical protein
MLEGYAADLLASTIGKFVDVQRDRLRISLWGGGCTATAALLPMHNHWQLGSCDKRLNTLLYIYGALVQL